MLPIDNDHLTMNPFKGEASHKMISTLKMMSAAASHGLNDSTIDSRTWVPQSLSPTQDEEAATHQLEKVPQPQKPVGNPIMDQGACSLMSATLGPSQDETSTAQDLLTKHGLVDPLAGFAKRARLDPAIPQGVRDRLAQAS